MKKTLHVDDRLLRNAKSACGAKTDTDTVRLGLEALVRHGAYERLRALRGSEPHARDMAAYGSLIAWARVMKHTEAADLLQETLDEEKAADEKLSSLAEGGINQEAAVAAQPEGEDKGEDAPAAKKGAKAAAAPQSKRRR